MDKYGGYMYKSYTAYTGVKPAPAFGEWNKQSYYPHGDLASRPDDGVKTSFVPDPARGTIPSVGDSERTKVPLHPLPHSHGRDGNLTGKTMVDMAYSPHLSKNSPPRNADQNYDEHIKKVHDEGRSAAPSNWHQPPYATGGHGIPGRIEPTSKPVHSSNVNGFANPGAYNSNGQYDWQPSGIGNMSRNATYDDHYHKNDASREPTTMNNGDWASPRRGHAAWEAPPPSHGAQLGEPIGMDSFKEPTQLTSTGAPHGTNGHGGYGCNDYNINEGNKPAYWNDKNGEYYQKNGGASLMEPTAGSWARPNAANWTPAPRTGTQLSQTTNDIDEVLGVLKGAANPTSGGPMSRYSVPISTAPNEVAYPETTHSRPSTRRYGNFIFPSQPR